MNQLEVNQAALIIREAFGGQEDLNRAIEAQRLQIEQDMADLRSGAKQPHEILADMMVRMDAPTVTK